jgi:predicted DNA-binding transcriptional regulator AlpA
MYMVVPMENLLGMVMWNQTIQVLRIVTVTSYCGLCSTTRNRVISKGANQLFPKNAGTPFPDLVK